MIELGDKRTIFVDCDETLVAWNLDNSLAIDNHAKVIIRTEDGDFELFQNHYNISFLKNLKRQNYTIVVWSACGGAWASKVVNSLHLNKYVDATMSKPEFAVDDLLEAKKIIKSIIWIDPETGEMKRNE